MISFPERLSSVFDILQSSPYKFANEHGFNRASLFNLVAGRTKPGLDMLERICEVEPRISAEYLLRGEGDPLRNLNEPTALSTVQQLREFQVQMNDFIEKRVQELEG